MGIQCRSLYYSRHAMERMFQRAVPPEVVAHVIADGEVVATYPDDTPFPSALLLGHHDGKPLHVVVAQDGATGHCHVVTVYRPTPELWDTTYKSRKKA